MSGVSILKSTSTTKTKKHHQVPVPPPKYIGTCVSLFCGAGGLDRGFSDNGFNVIWSNDNNKSIRPTYVINNPLTRHNTDSICNVKSSDIPDSDIIIGGPPCQSWSVAGSNKGTSDPRGKLFHEYIRIIRDKQPKMIIAENVEGITRKPHAKALARILRKLDRSGYNMTYGVVNASDYGVPQDRKRIIFVGIRKDLTSIKFKLPSPLKTDKLTLRDALQSVITRRAIPIKRTDEYDSPDCYLDDSWSSQFMSRNRVRQWDEQAFTLPASSRQITIHPQAPKMVKVDKDMWVFVKGKEHLYRRFTVAEAALIQTFPVDYVFDCKKIDVAYKMIGNAVPVMLATHIAKRVAKTFLTIL